MSTPSEPAEETHQLPRPISRQGRKNLFDPDAFANIADTAASTRMIEGMLQALHELEERREILQSGKGGWLIETPSVFAVPNQWVNGHLDLRVDEQHGEVRRRGFRMPIHFVVPSLEWHIFLAAWNGGARGCSAEQWERRDDMLKVKDREKAIRSHVNYKLKRLRIRLEPRRPPRFVEVTERIEVT